MAVDFKQGGFYDGVIVPEGCGFFKTKNEKAYLRLVIRDEAGIEHKYPWWISGKMADSLKEALPQMGVSIESIGREFMKNAAAYIQSTPCRFGVQEEEYEGRIRLRISGVYFGGGGGGSAAHALTEDDMSALYDKLTGKGSPDPFGGPTVNNDDDLPF